MLRIQTFDARAGGNVIYKALAHPLAAEAISSLYTRLEAPVALYDPDGIADALMAMYPTAVEVLFVHDVSAVGETRGGLTARPLTDIGDCGARTVLIAAFDAAKIVARVAPMLPAGATVLTLDDVRLPDALLTVRGRYLDKLNFATNFAFFRDEDGLSTRVVSANYWANYGPRRSAVAAAVRHGRRDPGDLGAEASGRSGRFFHRQPGRSGAFRARSVYRSVVHPCHRCGRAMMW